MFLVIYVAKFIENNYSLTFLECNDPPENTAKRQIDNVLENIGKY